MGKEFLKCQNTKTGQIKNVLKDTTNTSWFKNSDWVVLQTKGLKTETVELNETNTTEIVESSDETTVDEVDSLKEEIKAITGKRPKTTNIEKLRAQLNDLQNDGI